MPGIRDIYKAEDMESVNKLKEVTKWIESLPISSLPFVDMGFDTLQSTMIEQLNTSRDAIEVNFNNVNLGMKNQEFFPSKFLYAERFPFWASLFPENEVKHFKVSDRVMNICSIRRAYVPFGARGTVVGKTEQKIIVMFD